MAFGIEFPHTHNFDSDLREVLYYLKKLEKEYSNIETLYEEMKATLDEIQAKQTEIINYYNTIPALIDKSIKESLAEYKVEVENKLAEMRALLNSFTDTIADLEVILKRYTDAKVEGLLAQFRLDLLKYTSALQVQIDELKEKIDILPESLYVYCEPCGWHKPLQHALNDIYNSAREPHGLTVAEYAAYGLTVAEYDALQMTAIKYAMMAKAIINRFWYWHYNPITGIKNTVTNIASWLATNYYKTWTVAEYNAQDLTVEQYDALDMTTYDYLINNYPTGGFLMLGANGITVGEYETIGEAII